MIRRLSDSELLEIEDVGIGSFARPLARSLAPLTHSLAPHCSLAHSLAPELMGKRFLSMKRMRHFSYNFGP